MCGLMKKVVLVCRKWEQYSIMHVMIIGPKKLLQLVKNKKLVEGLSERELTNPGGAGFDLRLGEIYKIKGKAFLGVWMNSAGR